LRGISGLVRAAAAAVLLLALATSARADLTNPSTLALKEVEPSRFTVALTLPVIQGKVLKARPVLPDVCVIEGDAVVEGDASRVVRAWTMTCDPDDLVGRAIGVEGLLGTTIDVQLSIETLDGRRYVGQLRPTQAYYLVPPSPTLRSLAVDVAGEGLRQVLRRPELALLFLLCLCLGLRMPALLASAGAFSVALGFGRWLRTENWLDVSSFLPVMLVAGMGSVIAVRILRGREAARPVSLGALAALLASMGLLYGGRGLPALLVLSRGEQRLAFFFSALGTLAGLVLVLSSATLLLAGLAGLRDGAWDRLRFWIAFLAGASACAIGLHQATAPVFAGGVTPTLPLAPLLGAIALGAWCGVRVSRAPLLHSLVAGGLVSAGMVLSLRGHSLPQTTLVLYGSLALVGLLLARSVRGPGWAALSVVAVSCLYLGAHAGEVLLEGAVLPVAQATALGALLAFVYVAAWHAASGRGTEAGGVRWLGLATLLFAVTWRLVEYRDWLRGDVAVEATVGLFPFPVLAISLLLAALLMRPRRRRFQVDVATKPLPTHWCLALGALFTVSVAEIRVRNPLFTPRAPTAEMAQPIMAKLLTDTYLAFNLPEEEAAFDRLARGLTEDLVGDVYLDSRRRLLAGTREGAQVTVKDIAVTSVEAPIAIDTGAGSFTYPCTWVVTARVKHWQHIHDRQNVYVGTLTVRVEEDRWKISELELVSEEREVLPWRGT
jgi:hydrogenase/urease accessory protein HupE